MGGYVFASVGRYIRMSVNNFLVLVEVRFHQTWSVISLATGDEALNFGRSKGQGWWGRYALYWALLVLLCIDFYLRYAVLAHFVRFWVTGEASERAKFPEMWDSLPRTSMNHRAKFDAASFILGREICNCTNKQTNKKHTICTRYIHTLLIGMCR